MKKLRFVVTVLCLLFARELFSEDHQEFKSESTSPHSLFIRAQKLLSTRNEEDEKRAVVVLEKLLDCKNPRSFQNLDKVTCFQLLSKIYLKLGCIEKHEALCRRLLKDSTWKGDRVFLLAELSRSSLLQKRHEEAVRILKNNLQSILGKGSIREVLIIKALIREIDMYFEQIYIHACNLLRNKSYEEASYLLSIYLAALEERITPFENVSEVMQNVQIHRIRFWNAAALYHTEKYEEAAISLNRCNKDFFSCHELLRLDFPKMLLLQAQVFKKLKKNNDALRTYSELFAFMQTQHNVDEGRVVEAVTYAMRCKKWNKALEFTELLIAFTKKIQVTSKAILIKATMLLEMQNYDEVLKICSDLENASEYQHISFQLNCLKAKAYYSKAHYEKASKILEKAISSESKSKPVGYIKALTLLGNCYLHLLKRDLLSMMSCVYLDRAKNCFDEAFSIRQEFSAFFSLLQVDLLRYYSEKKREYIRDARTRFLSYENKLTDAQKQMCAILFLPVCKQVDLRFRMLDKVEKNTNAQEVFLIVKYYRALWSKDENSLAIFLNELQEALCKNAVQPALIGQMAAGFFYDVESCDVALKVIQLAKQYKIQDEELGFLETLYFASKSLYDANYSFAASGEYFDDFLALYPKGLRSKDASILKASLLVQAGSYDEAAKYLDPLLSKEAYALWYQDALFLKRLCTKSQGSLDNATHVQQFSHWSNVDYFFRYAIEDYKMSSKEAICHLQNAPFLEENSFYAMAAHYFLANALKSRAISKKDPEEVIPQLKKSLYHFEKVVQFCKRHEKIPNALNFRFHVELSALSVYEVLAKKDPKLHQLYENYVLAFHSELQQHVQCLLEKNDPLSSSHFLMVQSTGLKVCRNMKKKKCFDDLKKKLEEMTSGSDAISQTMSKYLVRASCMLSKLYLNENQFDKSLALLSTTEGLLSFERNKELFLEVMIAKSSCFCKMQKYDRAIMLLSQVINEDCVSSLRVRAMLYRAKIYEALHRPDLAVKQLEACARKGGDWAKIAKRRLEKSYGYIWDERVAS